MAMFTISRDYVCFIGEPIDPSVKFSYPRTKQTLLVEWWLSWW